MVQAAGVIEVFGCDPSHILPQARGINLAAMLDVGRTAE